MFPVYIRSIDDRVELHIDLVENKRPRHEFVCPNAERNETITYRDGCLHSHVVIHGEQEILLPRALLQNLNLVHGHPQIMTAIIIDESVVASCKTQARHEDECQQQGDGLDDSFRRKNTPFTYN